MWYREPAVIVGWVAALHVFFGILALLGVVWAKDALRLWAWPFIGSARYVAARRTNRAEKKDREKTAINDLHFQGHEALKHAKLCDKAIKDRDADYQTLRVLFGLAKKKAPPVGGETTGG